MADGTVRRRYHFTKQEKDFLRSQYDKTFYPTRTELSDMADSLGIPERRIQIWFQNQRAATKKRFHKERIQNPSEHNFAPQQALDLRTSNQSGHVSFPVNNYVHRNMVKQNHDKNGWPILADQSGLAVVENTQINSSFFSYSFTVDNRQIVVNVGDEVKQNKTAIPNQSQNYEYIENNDQQNSFTPELYNQNYVPYNSFQQNATQSGSSIESYSPEYSYNETQDPNTIPAELIPYAFPYYQNYGTAITSGILPDSEPNASQAESYSSIDSSCSNLFTIEPDQSTFESQARIQSENESLVSFLSASGYFNSDNIQTGYFGNGTLSENIYSPESGYTTDSPNPNCTDTQEPPAEQIDVAKIQSEIQNSVHFIYDLTQD